MKTLRFEVTSYLAVIRPETLSSSNSRSQMKGLVVAKVVVKVEIPHGLRSSLRPLNVYSSRV